MTMRPWKKGEHPIGAIVRRKSDGNRGMLLTRLTEANAEMLFKDFKWTWAHQQYTGPWWPCGTEDETP